MTYLVQLLNLTVNKVTKNFMKQKFSDWFMWQGRSWVILKSTTV